MTEPTQHHYTLVRKTVEQIGAELGIWLDADAYAQILAAHTAVRFWALADTMEKSKACDHKGRPLRADEKRIRRQRFFTFVAMAFELSTGKWAAVVYDKTYDELSDADIATFSGKFFEMAKICHDRLLPQHLRASGEIALGRIIDRALQRRTHDSSKHLRKRRLKRTPT